jgi:DNA-directed RNA polymerase subunit beta'
VADISPEKSFETLKSNVVQTISSHFPYEGRTQKVVLNNVWVDDKHESGDLKSQSEAKDFEKTWGVPVKADISLVDKQTGKVVDRAKITLAKIPKLTSRYGFIVGGNEYQVDHLFRLKSGVYARIQDNGDLESEFNLAKSPAGNFSILLDRESKKFFLKQKQSHIPLYPILKSMGVSDDDLEKEWGKAIFEANKSKNEQKTLKSLAKFFDKTADDEAKPQDLGGYAQYVNKFFDQTKLLPDTTKQTLGKPFEKVTGETLRLAANKILGVSRGTHDPDDRDSLAFKEVVSAEDFLPEAIERNARSIKARLRQTVDHKKRIVEIVQPRLFEDPIHDFFTKGGSVSERSDQTNPVQMMSSHRKTTLMSELGGIKKEHSLTDEMRVINPSHFGFLDPMHTPESERTGITLHLGIGVRKNGKTLETPVFNTKSGKLEYLPPPDFHQAVAVLPDQVRWEKGKPVPISEMVKVKTPGGSIEMRRFNEADYVMPSAKGMFGVASNLIPFLPTNQGNRVSMADKQMEQAISLKHRDAPLVQAKTDHTDPEHTFEKTFGNFSSIKSTVGGKVVAVKNDSVVVHDGKKKHEIHLYDHFPLNDPKGMMHSEPLVKPGDTVKPGQVIADTNFTKKGVLALGSNLRVGYIPYKGYNYEDGIVISESAAKKLTSEHLYKKKLEIDPELHVVGKKQFHAYAATQSTQMPKEHWDALDDDGIIKPGSKVVPGSVLVAAVKKNTDTKQGSVLAKLGKRTFSAFKNDALTWDEDHVGVVTKVVRDPNGKGVKVYVKTEEPMVVGDKISGRHGNKGIVTQILPDHEMPFTVDPHSKEKRPLEVLLNPSGVPTRINVGQILETAAGKIAEKVGKPYVVDNFAGPNHDYRKQVLEDLHKHGLSDEEHVFDPKDPNKPLGSVLVGPQHLFKLKHQVEKKLSVRGGGTDIAGKPLPVDADRQPSKGGERGGQGFGALELYALLGHNARANIREMSTYKSDLQPIEFWNHVQQGFEPPPPNVPFAYEKFVALLKGMGVNVTKEGTHLRLQPMTNKEVLQLAGHKNEIKAGHLALQSKNLKEEKDGLFDPHATGGLNGTKWSFMKLHEPMPNPIFVGSNNRPGPIPTLLGLKMKEIEDVMAGKMKLDGKTGGHAIEAALKKIDVKGELKSLRAELPKMNGSSLDRANKKLKVLQSLEEMNLHPHEAYVLQHIPVIPPVFRPVTQTPNGDLNYAPINGLYKAVSILNDKLKGSDPTKFSEEHRHPLRAELWNALKAMQSVGNYRPVYDEASEKRKLKGILDTIGGGEGEQPKEGFFQSRLIKRRQNLSIRSTIVPEPKLHIDEVGLPKGAAMELYKPFVVAQMHKWGLDPLTAQKQMKEGTSMAFKALEAVVADRPLLLKRDPALHKFSVMAFRPVLVEGKAIQIHPLVTGGFNADFDGDTMAGTVPVSREAVEEAKRLFPSKNLFSPTTGGIMYAPSQEAMLGLHLLSKWGKKTNKSFKNPLEADKAADRGEISHNDIIKIDGKETTLGRHMIAARLPQKFGGLQKLLHDPAFEISKGTMSSLSERMAKDHPTDFAKSVDELKNLGNDHAYRVGFSFGLKDLAPLKTRDHILGQAHKEADRLRKTITDKQELNKKLIEVYGDATSKIDEEMKKHLKGSDNRLATMVFSGARGKMEQLRQMVAAPMLMQDAQNRTIPMPVTKSYSEGLDLGDYWLAQHGARKGTLQRAMGTSEPGAISKDIINTTMSTLVTSQDCKTQQGVLLDLGHRDIHDRFTAKPYKLKDGTTLKPGTLLTPDLINRLKNSKIDKVVVRSPLKCQHGDGICSKCFGLNESGKLHDVGTNIGVLAGQALGEPAVQMAMDAFHSGGVATGRGAMSVSRFERLRQLLSMPKQIKNEATIAKVTGRITDIRKDPAGGLDVFINGERHYVPRNTVHDGLKVGVEVKKGQSLSHPEAPINPHHLLKSTDMPTVQNYLTNEMHGGLYEKEGVRRRNVEVVVRAMTNLTKVVDPGHSNYAHGDIVPHSVVEEHNRAVGKGKKPIAHEPILRNIEQVPLTGSKDWMARLNYRELHSTLQQAAAQGWKSDLHGSHPIPGLAYGKEFGKPPAGSKKHVY